MKKLSIFMVIILMGCSFIFFRCNQGQTDKTEVTNDSTQAQASPALPPYGGFENEVAWGKHIVTIGGCNDCHTPKKMGAMGPEDNMDLLLSGHPSQIPSPDISQKEIASKGILMGVGFTFTAFVGPWGTSYAANLTSDSTTGIGTWTEDQFILAMRKGKYGGASEGRNILPPMPWPGVAQMTDDELKAVYAYLESTKPIHNIVPQPKPPVLAMKK